MTIEAIYEDGVLRPVTPLKGVAEHSRVKVTIEQPHPLANCFGTLSDEDARDMREAVDQAFGQVNPDEWK